MRCLSRKPIESWWAKPLGFALTLAYIGMTVLSPAELFPELEPYRIMIWLAAAALLASLPVILNGAWQRLPHVYLLFGVIIAICVSRILQGWFGGVPQALSIFLPVATVFLLIVWNVTTLARLRTLSLLLIIIALYFVVRGIIAFHRGDAADPFVMFQTVSFDEAGERIGYYRIRALGFLNDPNDFAQFLLMLLPFLLPAWRRKRVFHNLVMCLLPAAVMLYGVYLTSSRGALLGLALLVIFLLKDKLGAKRSAFLTPVVILAILALNQSGRAFSVQEDSAMGRVNAWSDGLGMFESSPLWGIGFGLFTNYHERTAHNSFVLCLSELGLLGAFLWLGLIVACVLYLRMISQDHTSDNVDSGANWWGLALRSSLYMVLTTSWFLSRTYSSPLYLILGMAVALAAVDRCSNTRATPGRAGRGPLWFFCRS